MFSFQPVFWRCVVHEWGDCLRKAYIAAFELLVVEGLKSVSVVELDLPSDPKSIFGGKRVSGFLRRSLDQFVGSFGQWRWKWVANLVVVLVDALNRNWSWRMLHYICECYVNPLYSHLVILRLLPVIEAMLQELPFQPNSTIQVTRCGIRHFHKMGIFI